MMRGILEAVDACGGKVQLDSTTIELVGPPKADR